MDAHEDDAEHVVAPAGQESNPILLKLQESCIKAMRRKMPAWLVNEPVLVYVDDQRMRGAVARVTCPNGPIRFESRHFEAYLTGGASGKANLRRTMMHELIHLQVAREGVKENSHGPHFRKLALYFGLKGWGDKTWRWEYKCPTCGYWTKRHGRLTRRPTCRGGRFYDEKAHPEVKMVETDLVKLTRAVRARLAGKPVPATPAKPPVDKKAVKLQKDKEALARLERKAKLLATLIKKRRRSINARESAQKRTKKENSP